MPELPDVELYREALARHVGGATLAGLRLGSPFVLKSVAPAPSATHGRKVLDVQRLGKRLVLELDGGLFIIIHLMIAGRLRWRKPGAALPKRRGLAAFDFAAGTVLFTEEGTQHRAGLWLVEGAESLAQHDPGGADVFEMDALAFGDALRRERHTLKRTLTDPHVFSGIGNAYSDEILYAAQLSPLQLTTNLSDDEVARLHVAAVRVLREWTDRLRTDVGNEFPEKVTAFREGMAVHGRYRQPCPECGSPVQRIRYAANEVNYCATCQTGGKVLADRGISRLLREDWPRSLDEWTERIGATGPESVESARSAEP